jgi:hypothetical protein
MIMSTNDPDWATTKALLQHFEDEWVAGKNPNPADYLPRVPEADRVAFELSVCQIKAAGLPDKRGNAFLEFWLLKHSVTPLAMLVATAFVALLIVAPNLWAALMAAGFILVTGQLFTRIVLSMPASRKQWCYSLATGFGLLGFFWAIFKLKG